MSAPSEGLVIPDQRTSSSGTPGTSLWAVVPGWGIAADLTPPELIAGRHLRRVRRRVIIGLLVLVLLCGLGYVAASLQSASAAAALADEQSRTAALQVEARKYGDVTQVQGRITASEGQVARLLAQDVDLGALLGTLRDRLPAGMTINQLGATVNVAEPGAAGAATTAVTLDSTGSTAIGQITLQGSATSLDELPTFLDQLAGVDGLVAPLPLTNASSDTGITYSLQVTMTDALLTHRYDEKAK